ncbi:neuroguidin [Arctopsyche grandis]|uniref:neuroguidin n=1 Tax=Arctopsyche grandis TaxID=121162 RepID=UPI00406D9D07
MVQAAEETERQDLPQALRLLDEMNSNVRQVATLVDNMLQRVKSGEITTDKGLSFLEMKYHMLLSYLINLTYIVLRKCSGERIEADPAIDRLVEIRTVLEKIRPIDSKLKYQIDKLVKGAVTSAGSGNDPGLFRAHPENLVSKVEGDHSDASEDDEKESKDEETNAKTGIYVPPKFAAMHYDGDESHADKEKRQVDRHRKRALNSSVIRELRDEYLDTPMEISSGVRGQQIISKFQREKTEYEENYLTRLPLTKVEKHRQRKMSTIGNIADEITNFGDYSALDDNPSNSGTKKKKKRKIIRKKGKTFKKIRFH